MSERQRLILYRQVHRPNRYPYRFSIKPANGPGLLVFLLNLGAVLFGCFEMLGMYGHVPAWLGTTIFVISIAFFFYCLIFHTDYSDPSDAP